MSENEKIHVRVKRKDGLKMPRVMLQISIDQSLVGKVGPDGTTNIETTPGEHHMEVFVVRGIRAAGTYTFKEGSCINIEAKLGKIVLSVS